MKKCIIKTLSVVLLASCALLSGCSSASVASSSPSTASASNVEVQQNTDETNGNDFTGIIKIVHVNDVHGFAESTETAIGYAKLGAFIENTRAETPNTIVLDGGDTLQGSPLVAFDQGEGIIQPLNTLGIDAMAVGNADIMLGLDTLKARRDTLNYPMLSANITLADSTPVFNSHTIIELENGMKVGIVGLTTPDFLSDDLVYEDAVSVAKKVVEEIKPQTDLLIGLVHIGDNEEAEMNSILIANEVGEFEVLIDAHTHTVLENGHMVNDVLIAQTGEYGNAIGVVELTYENGALTNKTASLIKYEDMAEYTEKADTSNAMAALISNSETYFAQKIGETTVILDGTRDLVRSQETTMGNLVTDAMRIKTDADIAITTGSLIGGNLEPGGITKKDMLSIVRVASNINVRDMTGSDIINLVNEMLTS